MSKAMDDLAIEVSGIKDAEESAVALLVNLRQQLIDAGTDPVKLAELAASLKSSKDALAAAVVANTPPTP